MKKTLQKILMLHRPRSSNKQSGVTLLEVLVALTLLAMFGLAMAMNTITSLRFMKLVEVNHVANSMAISKMEEMASYDAVQLTPDMNETESAVSWAGLAITFTRITDITVNADGSRTVNVEVTSNSSVMTTDVEIENTFALWE